MGAAYDWRASISTGVDKISTWVDFFARKSVC